MTHPNIYFSVSMVSQFTHQPRHSHLQVVNRIFRYLTDTISHGLFLGRNTWLNLHAYDDVDWVSCYDKRRSTSGFCLFLGTNVALWRANKQGNVARSSTEAEEYRSVAHCVVELTRLPQLLGEIGVSLSTTPTLHYDNIFATYLALNPVFHAHTKHIELDVHFVRERVALGNLHVRYLPTEIQIVDVFTKGQMLVCSKLSFVELDSDLRKY